jgi:hypothetical protein
MDRLVDSYGGHLEAESLVLRTLLGRVSEAPFLILAKEARSKVEDWLSRHGLKRDGRPRQKNAAIDFEMMGMLARVMNDPDTSITEQCREGARIGFE